MPTVETLHGKPVIDYVAGEGLGKADGKVYRLRVSWDNDGFDELIEAFAEEEALESLDALVLGAWSMDEPVAREALEHLMPLVERLQGLRSLVFMDYEQEESEISWLISADLAPLLHALPKLEYFKTRGGEGLEFRELKHEALRSLIVETGGLGAQTITQIAAAALPELEHLELWLGSSDYGFDATLDTLKPLIVGLPYPEQCYPFAKLRSLALCNSELQDAIAEAFVGAPVLKQLDALDLSKGIMTDLGARALAECEDLGALTKLDVSRNYIADVTVFDRLRARGVEVDASGQKQPDGDYYYVELSE